MPTYTRIIATGSYLPEKILTNKELESIVDTTDEWIYQRSGIRQRHIAADGELTSDMAIKAAHKALEQAGLKPSDIDGIIVATTTPDRTFPSTAVIVQAGLGMSAGLAFDVQAVCAGFIYALSTADGLMRAGQAKRMLVIGAEKISAILNWEDRATCVLFGDGAGAVILEAHEGQEGAQSDGILSTHLYADGSFKDILYTDGGVSLNGISGHIIMHGREVFKQAVNLMSDAVTAALEHNNLQVSDVDWLIPHQANIRIIESTARKSGFSMENVVVTVHNHGNTSAASIPLALDEAIRSGQVKKGQLALFEALGGGLTWGSALVRL
ncbi:MAG: ketoacyl-ACP synthase III [Alphaproteobacteria bacterium]|nr:ketoacyl-ACP synthase III [Alphaproteobacteria bacterium]